MKLEFITDSPLLMKMTFTINSIPFEDVVFPTLALLFPIAAAAPTAMDQIKSMAGCFEVTFQYADRQVLDPRYSGNPVKRSTAIEWVVVDAESEGRVELQHILVSGPAMIKHWRQIWTYEGSLTTEYLGQERHSIRAIPPSGVDGRWTQLVTNVDDTPRYGCAGSWTRSAEGMEWRCTVDAPLPRREKSHRHEYDILERTNVHRVVAEGWDHDQYNTKIRLDEDGRTVMAREVGHNTYRRIDDAQCAEASDWWPEEQAIWGEIRAAWSEVIGDAKPEPRTVVIDEKQGLTPLWVDLFWLARRSAKRSRPLDEVHSMAVKILEKHVEHDTSAP